jgi:hypothetical protein
MANAIATADRAGLGSRDQARRLPAEARRGLVGIRFERLRATAKAVDLCSMVRTGGASHLSRKAATFARAG